MRLAFLELSQADRMVVLQQAALERNMALPVMEKDFWVSWVLAACFGSTGLGDSLVFKGGTSLSKVAGAIDRFSEDIDLSLAPARVGLDEQEIERAPSRRQRDHWMERLERACARVVDSEVRPELEAVAREVLGARPTGVDW